MTKRFKNVIEGNFVLFYDGDEQIPFDEVVGVLNSLNDENEQLKKELHKIKVVNEMLSMDFANSEHELYKENEQLKFERDDYQNDAIKFEKECKRLANNLRLTAGDWKYEQLMHKKLEKENEQLKQQIKKLESQLYCPYDSICINCVNEYLVQKDKYYVSKCKKGHEQCSRTDVKYCDDFELKGDVE